MPEVTSNATVAISLVLKDGGAETVKPGETKSVAYDPDNSHNKQMFAMGALSAGKATASSGATKSSSKKSGGKRSRR